MSNINKLLTISIAAYNVEKYLDQTLSSLNDKRFLDYIEVLIVDDGSKDATKDIALKYQNIVPETFRYIAKENGGHGSTINKGIELATGKYFKVIDGDDWVDTDSFAKYIECLRKTDADLILTSYKTWCEGKEKQIDLVRNMDVGRIYMWDEISYIHQVTLHMLTVKTKQLKSNNIKITEKCFYVDIEFDIWSTYISNTIVYFDNPIYMYRIGNDGQSIAKENMLKNIEMQKKVALNVVSIYKEFLTKDLPSKKKDTIFRLVLQSVGATFRTYLLFDNISNVKKQVTEFDNKIKAISGKVFTDLSDDKFIKILRFNNYSLIPILRIIYRIWILKY